LVAEFLTSGRLLVARGESGLELYSQDGRLAQRFELPCESFVLSDDETRVIAMTKRGESTVLYRAELDTGRSGRWGELAIQRSAETFDGELFYVSVGGRVHALDATSASPTESLWVSAPYEGTIESIHVDKMGMRYAVIVDGQSEVWVYSALPHRLLRRLPAARGAFVDYDDRKMEVSVAEEGESLRRGDRSLLLPGAIAELFLVEWRESTERRFVIRYNDIAGHDDEIEFVVDVDELRIAVVLPNVHYHASSIRRGKCTWSDASGAVYWCDLERRILLARRSIV
jgi:hypothetical protein